MRRIAVLAWILGLSAWALAATSVTPTTTLTAETSDNTSTASTFTTQTNGNLGATNISKVDIRTLLYPGSNTPVYAHFMAWFGQSNHMNVGYTSDDPTQVHNQVSDALSRGISGFIVDWYGPNNTMPNQTTFVLKSESESRNGAFTFAVDYDGGALKTCNSTAGCDLTQQAISDLTYAYNNFEGSPAYMRIGARPVVLFFDPDRYGTLNWSLIASSVPGNPMFVFRNSGGFTHAQTSGSYSWVTINTSNANDWGQSYLDNFYSTALKYPTEEAYGAGWKGFNDTLAAWGSNRIMNQNCGQTWLNTLNEMGKYYSATNQLDFIQLVTWNDYEEGSELESGIDNCVGISAAMSSSSVVSWTITGSESMVDHYTVFISTDGQNLMPLPDVPAGTHQLDLSTFGFAAGTYTVYVKEVGKPSLKNAMSGAVSYSVADLPPTATLTVNPTSGTAPVSVTASTSGSSDPDGTIASSSIDFGDGTVMAGPTATHTYNAAGSYTVTATVTDNGGKSSTATATVTVTADQPPLATISVTPSTGMAPLTVTASTSASSDPDGTITSSSINFGDGTTVAGPTASHTYSTAGTYTVTGTVTDNAGLQASASTAVTVNGTATGSVTMTSPLNGATVASPVHVVASATSNYPITGMKIYVDNVSAYSTSASSVDTSLSMAPGSHLVVAQAWDSTGAVYKTSATITVADQPPVANLAVTPPMGAAPLAVSASTSGSSDPDGTITASSINFGDGTVVSATTASHTYATPGSYTVTATVTDNGGLTASTNAVVTVGGVIVSTPLPNSSVNSPVTVTASAKPGNPSAPITAMKVYVDGVAKYSISASSFSTAIGMTKGTHNLTVQAWDSLGNVYKNSFTISVVKNRLAVKAASALR